jgi:hypothetical protein
MTNHARKAAEEISRWVCSVIVKYDGPISHFDGSNPFEQIIAPHFSTAIADATAEQGREIDRLAELVERFGEAATFTREAIRDNLKAAQYKNEPLLLEAFNKCDDALLCAATSRPRAALEAALNT